MINGSRNQVAEMGVGPLTITPTDPLVKLLLPTPSTLYSAGLEILVLKGGMYLLGDATIIHSIN